MNYTRRRLSWLSSFMTLFILASLTLLSGCGGGSSSTGTGIGTGTGTGNGSGGATTHIALYTTAPSAVTMTTTGTATYTVAGGTSPYSTASSNEGVAAVVANGSTVIITGKVAGTASIVVKDAVGASVTIDVTVANSAGAALYTTAPLAITISAIGGAQIFTIGGGTAPYTCTSDNANVVSVNLVCTAGMTITGLGDGKASILIQDATGSASKTIAVNVATGGGFTVLGSGSWTIPAAHCSASPYVPYTVPAYSVYFINGGTPPYTVSSTSPLVGSIIGVGTNSNQLAAPSGAQSVYFGSRTVEAGGYFVVAWPDADNDCSNGSVSFLVKDATGLLPTSAPTFSVTLKQ